VDEETPQGAHLHPKVTSVLLVGLGRSDVLPSGGPYSFGRRVVLAK
jgi:hypothetical protein